MTPPADMKVLNHRHSKEHVGVNIDHRSKWGNPFVIPRDGNRAEVIEQYRAYLDARPDLKAAAHRELRGKNLICWCAPLACHDDILLAVANEPDAPDSG